MPAVRLLHIVRACLLLGASLLAQGCASIVHGGARPLTLDSQPSGAQVTVTKAGTNEIVHRGTTPLTVLLSPKAGYFKGQSYELSFELRGYRPLRVPVRSELSGWYWGNIVFGGLIGMLVVDPITGSMWNLSPEKIAPALTPVEAARMKTGEGFIVALLADLDERHRPDLVRIH